MATDCRGKVAQMRGKRNTYQQYVEYAKNPLRSAPPLRGARAKARGVSSTSLGGYCQCSPEGGGSLSHRTSPPL